MATHRLRFYFDPGSGICLWSGNDAARARFGYPVEAQSLPLTPPLVSRTNDLCSQVDETIRAGDRGSPSPWSHGRWVRFNADAQALLALLRVELGPEFEVIDESATDRDRGLGE